MSVNDNLAIIQEAISMINDIRIIQLLCSKLCHDLVGISSAVNAGVEMCEEIQNLESESFHLIKNSAQQVSERLAFFRVAFGLAEGKRGSITISELKSLSLGLINQKKIKLKWRELLQTDPSNPINGRVAKILLNFILIGESCLPRGGTISLLCVERDGLLGLAVEADGQGCDLPKHHLQALSKDCEVEELNPTNIASYFLQCLVHDLGGEVTFDVDNENGIVKFTTFLKHFNQNLLDG